MSMYQKNNKVDEEREFFAGLFIIPCFVCLCVTPVLLLVGLGFGWHNHRHSSNGFRGYWLGNRTRRVQAVVPQPNDP